SVVLCASRPSVYSKSSWADELQTFQKTVVVSVASDPEPGDLVVLEQSDGTVRDGDAHGVHRFPFVDLLELEAGVLRVFPKEA
ncbi:MAG: hypothetical protein WEB50_11885, partial [Vicinamibacterales bacterium]